jgi:O-acetylhomoserine/O-acetylserine sulfhydrylase-like pyridoxal-dependent enzyme
LSALNRIRGQALGADISMTSATKFLAGHSDVTGGVLSVKGAELIKKSYWNTRKILLSFSSNQPRSHLVIINHSTTTFIKHLSSNIIDE